jgi:RHS repeat-associated protein
MVMTNTGRCFLAQRPDFFFRFTGKERDAETGLDNFEARYYSGPQGRFMRPDDPFADQSSEDPQSWNLYAYTRNNPLRFVDPSGNACRVASNGTEYDDDNEGQSCAEVHEADGNNGENVKPSESADAYMPGGLSPIGIAFYNQMSAQRQATNQLIGVAAGASVALGATGGLASAYLGGTALTTLSIPAATLPPLVSNPTLQSIVNKLFQVTDKLPGGTAGAVRYELATGGLMSPSGHSIKAQQAITSLTNLLKSGKLSYNDQIVSRQIIQELSDALKTQPRR